MDNSNKIILDLCGGTGAWSQPYKDAGYDVRVISFPEFDVFDIVTLGEDLRLYSHFKEEWTSLPLQNIYGILAAPTCTHFSLARTTAKTPRDLAKAYKLVDKCLEIIRFVRINGGNLKFWALENPMGYLRQLLGRPALTFNPADYGDAHTKKTDLWGYYNPPRKKPVELTDQQMRDCSINNRMLPKIPSGYICPSDISRQAVRRSITPRGFALQFFKSNKP